jgi:glyoxylase-like metal-dependent hydrolase (beta-lactamase superfamily II)/rhodanese-related sulfurtransferase
MFIQQLYTSCLAQAAYYIESNGEVAIIDPLRDYESYLALAKERGANIKYIFETHFHADFVSGHIDLAHKTGAKIVYGPTTQTTYPVHVAKDGEVLKLGNISIKVLHTPGHTPESSCFLLVDENGKDYCVFTGDTLFVGDVGRPDLLDGLITKEELAGMMYDSLQNKLLPLADDVLVYPAHGAGSACGKNIGKETFSSIGEQRANNYALQPMTKVQFIAVVTDGIQPAPAYFFKDAKLNKQGYAKFDEVLSNALKPLTVSELETEIKNGTTIIDTRNTDLFELGFITGSLNFGLDGQYAIWAATILDIGASVVLVTEIGKEQESVERLMRVGFDNIKGFLNGGFEAWLDAEKRYDMVISIDDEEFELDVKHAEVGVLDVRKLGEFNDLHVDSAQHFSLDKIVENTKTLDPNKEYLVHCAGGYRSMIAVSYLKAHGIKNVKNVWGGFGKIKERGGLKYVSSAVGNA